MLAIDGISDKKSVAQNRNGGNNSSSSSATSNVRSAVSLSDTLTKAWDYISGEDDSWDSIFKNKITDEIAPGYSKTIKYPMDLSMMKKKITTGKYHNFSEFDKDVMLMCNNCITYNGREHLCGEVSPMKYFDSC